jgi:predicted NUDIX family NTP pyrophosphohydrolase
MPKDCHQKPECRYSSLPPGGQRFAGFSWPPGGPVLEKDLGVWTLPKGLIAPGEDPLAAAQREFAEETGHVPQGEFISLGDAKQPGGKIVHIWAVQEDWEADLLRSNTFEMEWPVKSGRRQSFPELDRAGWFAGVTRLHR